MQLTSLFPIGLQLWVSRSGAVQPRVWSWIFLAGSVLCSVIAPILYVAVPVAISSIVLFCGSTLQVFILLEALLVAKDAKVHIS